jgi:hypothetical protein
MSSKIKFEGLTDEVMEKYHNKFIDNSLCHRELYKVPFKAYILNEPKCDNIYQEVRDATFLINAFLLDIKDDIVRNIDNLAYRRWKEDGELWFYNFETVESDFDDDMENDGFYDDIVEKFVFLKFFAPSGNYVDDESGFAKKLDRINEELDRYEEEVSTFRISKIVKELKDYIKHDEIKIE